MLLSSCPVSSHTSAARTAEDPYTKQQARPQPKPTAKSTTTPLTASTMTRQSLYAPHVGLQTRNKVQTGSHTRQKHNLNGERHIAESITSSLPDLSLYLYINGQREMAQRMAALRHAKEDNARGCDSLRRLRTLSGAPPPTQVASPDIIRGVQRRR